MPTATITNETVAGEQTWRQVERLVFMMAYRHHERYGGELEEIQAQARLHFWNAAKTWNPDTAKLTTWVGFVVSKSLLDDRCNAARKHANDKRAERHEPQRREQLASRFSVGKFLSDLSRDAATAVKLCVRCRQATPRNVEKMVKEHLYDLGWSALQIAKTWNEIKEALGQ